jgi:predicted dehydrogenase
MTRRELLRRTAAGMAAGVAAPYVLTSSALGGAGKLPASERVMLGVIGTGGRASAFLGNQNILAVCDVDAETRDNALVQVLVKNPSAKSYNDFREVLARPDIDAVVIVTPDHWHCQISAMAALAGKDVYCEKPLSAYVAEGRALADLIKRRSTIFQTGSQQRSDGLFRHACELVRNGRIGKLKSVSVGLLPGQPSPPLVPQVVPPGLDYDLWLGAAPWVPYMKDRCKYNFRFQLDYAAGKISDWGAHHLDIAQWAMGTDRSGPVEIEGTGEFPTGGLFDTAIHFDVTFTYANGLKLRARDEDRDFPLGIRFDGEDGWVFVTRGKIETDPPGLRTARFRPDEVHLYRSENHWTNFLNCVRSRQEPIAPVEVSHRTVTMCHLANVAMLLKRKVKWDPAAETFPGDEEANRMPMIRRARRQPWMF